MKRKCVIKILSLLLTTALTLGSLALNMPPMLTAHAAMPTGAAGQVYDGVDFTVLSTPGNGIYYGIYNHAKELSDNNGQQGSATLEGTYKPILWRVMGEESGGGNITLMSEYVLDSMAFHHTNNPGANYYNNSAIRGWLNGAFLNSFESAEEDSMATTTVVTGLYLYNTGVEQIGTYKSSNDNHTYSEPLPWTASGDKVYLLWAKYRERTAYWTAGNDASEGLLSDNTATLKGGKAVFWWTRSPASDKSPNPLVGAPKNSVSGSEASYSNGVRPAFQLIPSSVIFTSEIVSSGGDGMGTVDAGSKGYSHASEGGVAKKFKLTILDSPSVNTLTGIPTSSQTVTGGQPLTLSSLTPSQTSSDYTVNYKIVGDDSDEREIFAYGFKNSASSVDLPLDTASLAAGGYDVYVWLQKNNDMNSNEASAVQHFELTVTAPPPPVLTATPTDISFGNVTVNTASAPQTVTASGADLTDDITYDITGDANAFSLGAAGWTAAGGGALEVTFTPGATQTYNAALTFSSNGATSKTVTLTGTGTSGGGYVPPPANPSQPTNDSDSSSSSATYDWTFDKSAPKPYRGTLTLATEPNAEGVLNATVTKGMLQDAINKGGGNNILEFVFRTVKTINGMGVTFDTDALALLESSGCQAYITTNDFKFGFDLAAIKEINKQSGNSAAVISARKTDKTSTAFGDAIRKGTAWDVNISYKKSGEARTIESLGSGKMMCGIKYTLTSVEWSGNLAMARQGANGQPVFMELSSYDNGFVIGTVNTSSIYGVGYKTPAVVFTDITNHWAKDDIDFVASRGLISGDGASFSPDKAITRADFLMAMGKLSGADVSGYKASGFTDVNASSPAMPYIEWAVANNIVQGVGGNLFAPELNVTREEIAVILHNYARFINLNLPKGSGGVFVDEANVSAWATDAANAMTAAGIIGGKPGRLFDPQGQTTRAEAAAMLHRFIIAAAIN